MLRQRRRRRRAAMQGLSFPGLAAGMAAGMAVWGLGERSAYALQGGEDPASLPVLIDKRHSLGSAHQLSLMFSTGIVTKFVDSVGGFAAYQYNFSDLIGAELSFGYLFGRESDTMENVRQVISSEPAFSDLYQLQWLASADLVLVPVYGKISFASTFDPSFDVYLLVGAGVGGARRQNGVKDDRTFVSSTTPVFNFGLGFRFYLVRFDSGNDVALRLEVRDFFFPEIDPNEKGVTFDLHFQGGLQFAFGGES